jgi:hypothetical protein
LLRAGFRGLRLRCLGCDRVGQRMTKEHYFPNWLIEFAGVKYEGITWFEKRNVDPTSATIPLCNECNNSFATVLEGPVSSIFRSLRAGNPISDQDAELLVRWLWKFEGLQWSLRASQMPHALYTERYTLRERVTSPHAFAELRPHLVLAVARSHANDPGFRDWPLGLDTPPSENAIHMSGVFGEIALLSSLTDFARVIPDVFGKYEFGPVPADRTAPVFDPPCAFLTANGAIQATVDAARLLAELHDGAAAERRPRPSSGGIITLPRPRIELPPV